MLINVDIVKYHPSVCGVIQIKSDVIGLVWVYEEDLMRADNEARESLKSNQENTI